ncbi:MAG: hypothetical protein KatS3mg106_601 [Gemmataceae bacterium]|jgi:hypothetical protein|nr:MAG: hypothetical protein KatS3mg106_601 [Gemmataceae bacterium]
MPRCPYCDAEYILGEIYCKNCNEDLSHLEPSPDSGSAAQPDPLQMSAPLSPPPTQPTAQPGELDLGAPANVHEVPPSPQVPVPPSVAQQPVSHSPTPSIGQAPAPVPSEVSAPVVGPVCPHCGRTNEKDSKYCDGCGKPLGAQCPSCGGANRPGAKFCQHCGHKLSAPITAPPGVSAPLTPSVGSTPLATKSYTLILLSKDGRELTRFALREGVNQVGVKSVGEGIFPDVDLSSVDNDQVVSRRHAILRVSRDHVTIADCGSTNGTYVDGTKIGSSEVPLNDQNIIKFANIFAKIIQS